MLKQQFLSYIPLAGLALLLILSWIYLNQSPKGLDELAHSALQERFQSVVSDYVKKNYPSIHQITFHKTWTENTPDPNHIKIYFSYSLTIEDDKADSEMVMDGTAALNRKSGSNNWLLTDFKVTDSLVEFSKPLVIKAISEEGADPSDSPPEI
ncbi:MAG: hypothetical protein OXB86_06650 [Bdellovibrionales bacterium]|nr:hypothetical protein [Bdellovibrionales bacterium]